MNYNIKPLALAFILSAGLMFAGCSGGEKSPSPKRAELGGMDNSGFHNQQGDKYLTSGNYDEAVNAFQKAIDLNKNNSHAQSGLFVAMAHQTSRPEVSNKTKEKVAEKGKGLINKALSNAKNNQEKARVHHFATRFYVVLGRPANWYKKAKAHFEQAKKLSPNQADAYFYMASAEVNKLNYPAATRLYKKVLRLDGGFADEADQALIRIQKVERALPGSKFGSSVGNKSAINRADTAALFISELRLDRLYLDQQEKSSSKFSPPDGQRAYKKLSPSQEMPEATDLTGHPLKDTIQLVLNLGIKGLEADAGHKFYPSEALTRAEFAMILQDILIKVTKKPRLATKYIGSNSPYQDVKASIWYYNAARVAVTRGLMKVDLASGNFNPTGKVSGAETLLAIRKLKGILNRYK